MDFFKRRVRTWWHGSATGTEDERGERAECGVGDAVYVGRAGGGVSVGGYYGGANKCDVAVYYVSEANKID